MPLAPIRGAPPGAPIPDFPRDVPAAETVHPPAPAPTTVHDSPAASRPRRPYSPFEIRGDETTLSFTVIPELPAIRRSSMLVRISADTTAGRPAHTLASFEMSPVTAERFLIALRNQHSPIVIGEPMQLECDVTASALVFTVREPGRGAASRRFSVDRTFDVTAMADHLLADLGTAG